MDDVVGTRVGKASQQGNLTRPAGVENRSRAPLPEASRVSQQSRRLGDTHGPFESWSRRRITISSSSVMPLCPTESTSRCRRRNDRGGRGLVNRHDRCLGD